MAKNRLKSFAIELRYDKTKYFPGESISGLIIIEPYPKQIITKLRVGIHGIGKVFWTEATYSPRQSVRVQNSRDKDVRNVVHYFDTEKSVFESRRASAPSGPREQHRPLVMSGLMGKEEFPFVFMLPDKGYPPSWHGLYGTVYYWIEAMAEVGGFEAFHEETAHSIEILPVPKLAIVNPKPVYQRLTVLNIGCGRSTVSASVQLDRSCYAPGEAIVITVDLKNHSPWQILPHGSFIRVETYAAKKTVAKRIEDVLLQCNGPKIAPHSEVQWILPSWKLPTTTPVTLMDCAIIRNQYFVVIKLGVRRFFSEVVEISCPVSVVSQCMPSLTEGESNSNTTLDTPDTEPVSNGILHPLSRKSSVDSDGIIFAVPDSISFSHENTMKLAPKHQLTIVREESVCDSTEPTEKDIFPN